MTNIHPETRRFLDRAAKEQLLRQKGVVLWRYGLSGSGKSTIANEVERVSHGGGRMTVILDGGNLRTGLNGIRHTAYGKSCLPRAARVALRATFGRLPRAAFRAGGRRGAGG